MKTHDTLAIVLGTTAGAISADSLEQIISSAAAAVAVYLVKMAADYIRRRWIRPGEK